MFKIQTLNNISPIGLEHFPDNAYSVADEQSDPDAIVLRSFNMHDLSVPNTVKAVARAGAGVNNIPIDAFSAKGIPVFNSPGANANAVKELVIAGMLLASRNIFQAWEFAKTLEGSDDEIHQHVEQGKKQFVGAEIAGKTIGVIGLGAIGVKIANAALALDMSVVGYDPGVTVERAWELSANVEQAESIEAMMSGCDFVSIHVPLYEATHNLIDAKRLALLQPHAVLLNFARDGIVDEVALTDALAADQLAMYVTDFPSMILLEQPRVIKLPHLGASTQEAEENCAVMAVKQLRDYLEHGEITNSVNFPAAHMQRTEGFRIAITNANVPNMVGQITAVLAGAGLNIIDLLNKSRGELAYTLVDVNAEVSPDVYTAICAIDGVLSARLL